MKLDQEKRVMLAFALSIVMLVVFKIFVIKDQPQAPKKAEQTAAAPHASQPGAAPTSTPAPTTSAPAPAPAPVPLTVMRGAKAEELVVENNLYRVTFSTVGGVVRSWVLKGYPKGDQSDTINALACKTLGFPLSVTLSDSAMSSQVNQAIYLAKAYKGEAVPKGQEPVELTGNTFSPPVSLTFTYSDGKIQVKKQFSFTDKYPVNASVSVFDGQHNLPVEVAWPGGFGDQSVGAAMASLSDKAFYETADEAKVREVTLTPSFFGRFFSGGNANTTEQVISGPLVFAGLEDRFFTGILLPNGPDTKARITRDVWTPPDFQGEDKDKPRPLDVRLATQSAKPLDFRIFIAPKDVDVLRAMNPPLDSIVDFGWF
jgi:YidC/Oxa1 family membrane protein insertase